MSRLVEPDRTRSDSHVLRGLTLLISANGAGVIALLAILPDRVANGDPVTEMIATVLPFFIIGLYGSSGMYMGYLTLMITEDHPEFGGKARGFLFLFAAIFLLACSFLGLGGFFFGLLKIYAFANTPV